MEAVRLNLTLKRTSNLCPMASHHFNRAGEATVSIIYACIKHGALLVGKHRDKSYSLFRIEDGKLCWLAFSLDRDSLPPDMMDETCLDSESIRRAVSDGCFDV